MVDDYLRGVGMPRNDRRVEQVLGIGVLRHEAT